MIITINPQEQRRTMKWPEKNEGRCQQMRAAHELDKKVGVVIKTHNKFYRSVKYNGGILQYFQNPMFTKQIADP